MVDSHRLQFYLFFLKSLDYYLDASYFLYLLLIKKLLNTNKYSLIARKHTVSKYYLQYNKKTHQIERIWKQEFFLLSYISAIKFMLNNLRE